MKRAFIVHGWGGNPEEGWFPWLKKELEVKGFKVEVPEMPETDNPQIDAWVSYLRNKVGTVDKNTFLIGHSIGCQTILRFLESCSEEEKAGGVVLVAGWIDRLEGDMSDEELEIAKPWIETPIDLPYIKNRAEEFIGIFSDNDEFVRLPEKNEGIFEKKLGAKIIIEHDKHHFSGSDGVDTLPSALESVLEISK